MNSDLLLDYFSRISDAPDAAIKLRRFVLEAAIRGKLVSEVPDTEPAHGLISHIQCEKNELLKSGLLKRVEKCEILANESLSFRLPPHWIVTTLRTLCLSITDGDHIPPPKSDDGIPFLVIGDVRDQTIRFENCRHVPEEYYAALDPVRRPLRGDILYTLVGSYGIPVPVRTDEPFCVQRHIGILRPSESINRTYLGYVLESRLVLDQATSVATGIAQKTVPLAGLRTIKIPLPPLAEQNRIVLKLEDLMAVCSRLQSAQNERESRRGHLTASVHHHLNGADREATRGHAQFFINHLPPLTARPDQIKQLQQTIIDLAARGMLVKQNPKEEAAPCLLQRIASERILLEKASGARRKLSSHLSNRVDAPQVDGELPPGWAWARITDLLSEPSQNGYPKKPDDAPDGVPILRISAGTVRRDGIVAEEEHKRISGVSSAELLQFQLRPGDLLACRFNGNKAFVGKLALYTGYLGMNHIYPDKLIRLRVFPGLVEPKLIQRFADSGVVRKQIESFSATTVGNWGISASNLATVRIPLPPLAEQQRIVSRIDELMSICAKLEEQLGSCQAEASHLLESVLHNALNSTSLAQLAKAL